MIDRELVPGKLRIVRRIGAGGMGVVYEAIHLGLDRRVAVKVIHPQSSESAEARARFFREARALALLQSEHIVQVLDVDTSPEGDPYMVMEYLEGRDLKRELSKRGPLPVAEAVGYLIQASSGVATAHGAGVVHRDIKPANIFITNLDGARRAKVLDFGVAKLSASPDQAVTGPTCLLGTPLYMSPEQLLGKEADPRSDVWALGVVLFQLLTGYSPFRVKNSGGIVTEILTGAAVLLQEARDDVPLGLSQVVARCLETVHAERFEDARELSAALAPFGAREPVVRVSARAPRGSSAPPPDAFANSERAQPSGELRAPKPSLRESETVTQGTQRLARTESPIALVVFGPPTDPAEPPTDPLATIRLLAPAPSSSQTPPSPVAFKSEDSQPAGSKRWRQLAMPIGGLLILALAIIVCSSLLARTTTAPAIERPHAWASTAIPTAIAEQRELVGGSPSEAASAGAAPAHSAAKPTPEAPRRSRPTSAFASNPARASLPMTTAKPQIVIAPAPPSGSAAVPLHL